MSPRPLLGGIVVLALVVRLAGLGDRLSADEGYTWLVASADSWGLLLDRIAAYENTPPLYYLLLAPLPHGDEAWLRLPALAAGVAAVPVLYAIVRPLGGERAALLAALGLAVAPYAVSFSNYARAFTVADLGLLVAVLGVVGGRRWVYVAGGAAAMWSQYDSALFLAALLAAAGLTRLRPWRELALWGALPLLALLPWLPEFARGLDALDETKVSPVYGLSVRDTLTALAFGEHGSADAPGLRTLQALAVVGVAAAGAWLARGRAALFAWTAAGTLALHALATAAGPDVFHQRYLTELVPLLAAVAALGVSALPRLAPVAALALAGLAVAVFAQRHGRELEPAVPAVPAGPVLTNSAVVAYYLREREVLVDRPFGLGPGRRCGGCVVVDDIRVAGGARAPGTAAGPFVVRK